MDYIFNEDCQIQGLNEIYQKYFFGKQDGFFVEVGAFDGIGWSNTAGLVNAGWGGIYFEPVPAHFQKCKTNYANNPKIQVFETALSNYCGKLELINCGAITSESAEFLKIHTNNTIDFKNHPTILCNVTTLNTILKQLSISPRFDLLSIDTEGSEPNVLAGFDIVYWKPKMVIVEVHEQHEKKALGANAPIINKFFSDFNYKKIYSDAINNIYVR